MLFEWIKQMNVMTWNECVASEWESKQLQFNSLTEEGNIMDRGTGSNGWNLKILMMGCLLQTCSFSCSFFLVRLWTQIVNTLVIK